MTRDWVVRGTHWARESVWQVQGASATRFFLRAAEDGGDASDLPRKKPRPSSVFDLHGILILLSAVLSKCLCNPLLSQRLSAPSSSLEGHALAFRIPLVTV